MSQTEKAILKMSQSKEKLEEFLSENTIIVGGKSKFNKKLMSIALSALTIFSTIAPLAGAAEPADGSSSESSVTSKKEVDKKKKSSIWSRLLKLSNIPVAIGLVALGYCKLKNTCDKYEKETERRNGIKGKSNNIPFISQMNQCPNKFLVNFVNQINTACCDDTNSPTKILCTYILQYSFLPANCYKETPVSKILFQLHSQFFTDFLYRLRNSGYLGASFCELYKGQSLYDSDRTYGEQRLITDDIAKNPNLCPKDKTRYLFLSLLSEFLTPVYDLSVSTCKTLGELLVTRYETRNPSVHDLLTNICPESEQRLPDCTFSKIYNLFQFLLADNHC